MKLVPRYTLVLAATVALVLSVFGALRLRVAREELEVDMRRDHRIIGRVLEVAVADLWRGSDPARATADTAALLERASQEEGTIRFAWSRDGGALETQAIEDDDLVSRFPVRVGAEQIGAVIAREPVSHIDDIVRGQTWYVFGGIAAVLAICALASFVMGTWVVGRPIRSLVEQARRIGRRDFSVVATVHRSDELGELARELAQAAEALAASLARSAAETEARLSAVEQMRHADRLATVGTLAAGIAHELGTPLSVVGGHAQMIAAGEVTGDAGLASARAIDREATRMGAIVRQLLDFARRKGPEGTSCAPGEVATRSLRLLALMAERAGVRCTVAAGAERAIIDEDSLQQVLTNLIVNAIQAMPGGGDLAITVARVQATHDARPPRPHLRIDLRDTGAGIPAEARPHLFEPFFTTKQPGEGTGLGLAVVHGIVVDHGGWIDVDSGARGTTFSLYLEEAT
ncbi:MAG: HAMP domain-containing protein [Deltaproteobacteria bacterium]|nr:HAMP domain-containing protein [Deltaproteobacteria bacterium]MCW5807372.1 HAMP domain-containing protein [Deltaproteobacteria bacterium]